MINDLRIPSQKVMSWKYMDDVSASEELSRNAISNFQSCLDDINSWSLSNWMKLNVKKCKELRVCFLKEKPHLQPLQLDGKELEVVTSHKVLGVIIQNDLKWNEQINAIVSKASKRLHILRVLRRGGLPAQDLLAIYHAIVRSVLEYCCVVWHHAIPKYLSEEVERVQKRAFRIILPGLHYADALKNLNCKTLKERRDELCLKTLNKIAIGGPLSRHIPSTRADAHGYNLRNPNILTLPRCRTERLRRSFIPSTIKLFNNKSKYPHVI